jgi:deoxyribonuclease IV
MLKMFDRLLGAHVSTAGGLQKTVERAQVLGCNCIQIFASNPRGWQSTPTSESDAHTYQQAASTHGVKTLIIHAIYLVNLASPKEEVAEKSLASMQRDLMSAKRLGALGLVLHPGSDLGDGQGVERLHKALKILLPSIPAGYDLPQTTGFKQLDLDIKKYIGYEKIGCIHLNDSKQPVGSHRDRHENLGEGFVGKAGLIHMLLHKPFAHLPFILETPGFDDQGPDQKNMQRMKQYVKV